MSSGRGLGRGALLRALMDSASSSSEEIPKPTSQETVQDSGLGRETNGTPPTTIRPPLDLNLSRSSGRGFVSSLSSDVSQPVGRGGMGRAKLIESLAQLPSRPAATQISSDENSDSAFVPRPMGRGAFIAGLKTAMRPDDLEMAQKLASPPRPPLEQKMSQLMVKSPPREVEMEPVLKHGKAGRTIDVACNYIRLKFDPDTGYFEYEVQFDPPVDSQSLRGKYLSKVFSQLGVATRTFDGQTLYLPVKLPDKVTVCQTTQHDETPVTIRIIFKKQKRMIDSMHLYNVLFNRIMRLLHYVQFNRKMFDPTAPKFIPQYKLEIWPGYVTAVDEYEGGVMLCLDVSHRILRQNTVLETMRDYCRADPANYKENALKALLGSVVLTRYNNRTYRIDDIIFDQNPMSTFHYRDREINFVEYYKSQYNLNILDIKQPLLLSRKERRISGKTEMQEDNLSLIPEFCYLTGMSDQMRGDMRVMREIASFTRVTPNQRVQALNKFCQNVSNNEQARAILKDWGLTLDMVPVSLQARALPAEDINFGNRTESAGEMADFGRQATNNHVLEAISLVNWLVIYTSRDQKVAKSFIECMERNSRPMGIQVFKPKVHMMDNDRTEAYVQTLRQLLTSDLQVVVLICPTSRDDRYAAIKRICCAEIPIASQVINAKTLSNEAKNRAIVQKIALQMNCKMGGTLWSVNIPFDNVMICGVDTFHSAGNKTESVSGFVASLNGSYTKWFSRAVIQKSKEELVNGLISSLRGALQAYQNANRQLPARIIIFRDGVGDGQLNMCKEYEIPQLQDACKLDFKDYNPDFTFIVVQKRINTRIFLKARDEMKNPLPGAVLDHTVTRRYMHDFFLVPQSVRQGTVTPTHYIVVHDSAGFSPDILQRLSYKLCFMYYNWPGTVRVPACCQYAHKLAFLIGQSVKRHASEKLEDKLYYL